MGPGGWTGYWLGALLLNMLGQVGSIISLSVIYLISLIWLTGIRPIYLVKHSIQSDQRLFPTNGRGIRAAPDASLQRKGAPGSEPEKD